MGHRYASALLPANCMIGQGPTWVIDNAETRALHHKKVEVKSDKESLGLFLLAVRDTDLAGNKKPGFLQVGLEPFDETAVCTYIRGLRYDHKSMLIATKIEQ